MNSRMNTEPRAGRNPATPRVRGFNSSLSTCLNADLNRSEGGMAPLPLTSSGHVWKLEPGPGVLLGHENEKCAFYPFCLTDGWLPWLSLSLPTARGTLVRAGDATELMDNALAEVPVGWGSATVVVPHAAAPGASSRDPPLDWKSGESVPCAAGAVLAVARNQTP